jgi:chemotaxis protein methyltransferase CheR
VTSAQTQSMLTPADDSYAGFCAVVFSLTGLDLAQYKRHQMERRVNGFARIAGCESLTEYEALVKDDAGQRAAFLDRVTINVSQLWRNPSYWSVLESTVIGELGESGRVRALCAGVSYGAEAYTLAGLCIEVLGETDVAVDILGTDIDPKMIARAQTGEFSEADARDAPREHLERYFDRHAGGWRARPELRELVRFEVADLLNFDPEPESLDLALCRNTVIYFESAVRDSVHERLARALRPGGRLVVGASERVSASHEHDLVPEFPFIYRKA